jgi:hypothetical protein
LPAGKAILQHWNDTCGIAFYEKTLKDLEQMDNETWKQLAKALLERYVAMVTSPQQPSQGAPPLAAAAVVASDAAASAAASAASAAGGGGGSGSGGDGGNGGGGGGRRCS